MSGAEKQDWQKKLYLMPGTRREPGIVLHQTLDKLPRIKAVVVAIEWDDGSVDIDWSQMQVGTLVWVGKHVEQLIDKVMSEGPVPAPQLEPPDAA